MLPSRVINNETPTERLLHVKPNYKSLRVFGCACWPNLRPYNNCKLMFRSKQCAFLGYSPLHKGVKCLDISTGRVYISRDVIFDETKFPFPDLHPNADAILRKEILLLPSHLSGIDHGGENNCADQMMTNPLNHTHELSDVAGENSSENREENDAQITSQMPYFMCHDVGGKSALELAGSASGLLQEQQRRQSAPRSEIGRAHV